MQAAHMTPTANELARLLRKAMNDNKPNYWDEKAREFDEANPEVYSLVKQFTYQVIGAGRKHYSIQAIFERIRWHTDIETSESNSGAKLNNNYLAYYSRKFMDDHPQHDGFFRTRKRGR